MARLLTQTEIWQQLKKSKRYRREFAAQFSKRAIPQQIALLRKQFGITQGELAKRAEMTQGAVSRAVDPEYGNLTVNTLVRIASGFDLVFVGTFVRWSELPRWFNRFYSEPFIVPSFEEEDAALDERAPETPTLDFHRQYQRAEEEKVMASTFAAPVLEKRAARAGASARKIQLSFDFFRQTTSADILTFGRKAQQNAGAVGTSEPMARADASAAGKVYAYA